MEKRTGQKKKMGRRKTVPGEKLFDEYVRSTYTHYCTRQSETIERLPFFDRFPLGGQNACSTHALAYVADE